MQILVLFSWLAILVLAVVLLATIGWISGLLNRNPTAWLVLYAVLGIVLLLAVALLTVASRLRARGG